MFGTARGDCRDGRRGDERAGERIIDTAPPRSADRAQRRSAMSTPAVEAVLAEHAELELRLADPDVHADAATARKLGRRYSQIGPIVAVARELASVREDEAAARELAA